WQRAREAWETSQREPFGHGWATAGWVHSDLLEVAENLGVVPALLFGGAYLVGLWRLGRRVWTGLRSGVQGDLAHLGLPFLLSYPALGGFLVMECLIVLPQLVLPGWLIWVLAEIWLRQTALARRSAR